MKSAGFDLGGTLIHYENVPLSCKDLDREALKMMEVGYRKPRTEGFAQLAKRLGQQITVSSLSEVLNYI